MSITGKRPKRAAWFELAEAASLGIEMAVAVAIGWFGGRWLETHVTHWAPYTRWLGLGFGLGAATMAVIRTVLVFRKKLEQEELTLGGGAPTRGPGEADPTAIRPPAADAGSTGEDPGRGPADDA
ncbi:MAG: AtpZ/AtpI family protein [Nannocystaceae bacterium]